MTEDEVRNTFAEGAKTWVGVPYRHRGISREGCDCTGLIIGQLKEMGYATNYRLRYYPMDWNLHGGAGDYIREELISVASPVSSYQLIIAGDILLFSFGKCFAHAGVYIGDQLFVHSFLTAGECKYAKLTASRWGLRWKDTFRLDYAKLLKVE